MSSVSHDAPTQLSFNQITDHIFIGNNVCCQVHFDSELLEFGIEVDISLEKERIDEPYGVEMFTWIPVTDHTAPTQDQLRYGVSAIDQSVQMNKKVYVHCQNGHGRAPTLVAAYFISRGEGVDEAIARIAKKRPEIHLEDVQVTALRLYSDSQQTDE